jgi:hypothetical protein
MVEHSLAAPYQQYTIVRRSYHVINRQTKVWLWLLAILHFRAQIVLTQSVVEDLTKIQQ